MVNAFHFDQLREHGGLRGVEDDGLIESALARPRQKANYEEPSLYDLAAAYTFGLAKNHGYKDGNKRVGLVAGAAFLHVNGIDFVADEQEAVIVMQSVCENETDEAMLANWFKQHSTAR